MSRTLIFFVLVCIIKFLYSLQIGIIPDEAYYWEWSRNLDLSYYDQGPGTAFYIRFFTFFLGDNLTSLKLGAFFSTLITGFFLFLTASKLKLKKRQLTYLSLFLCFIPSFFGGSLFLLHDSVLLLFWSISLYSSISYILEKKSFYLYQLFLSLALGTLSKHTMVFFAFSLILWLLITKEYWFLLRNFNFYFALLIAFCFMIPLLYWNSQNGWNNIDAILNLRSSGGANFKKATTGIYLAGQALSISPFWFLGALFLLGAGISKLKTFLSKAPEHKFLIINTLILPLFFLVMSFKKDIQANWVFPSYLGLILLLSIEMEWKNKIYQKLIQLGFIIAMLMNIYTVFSKEIVSLFKLKLETYTIPYYRTKGFEEIYKLAEIKKSEVDPKSIFVTNRYQDASILSWYSPRKEFIKSLNILQKNQYNLWEGIEKGKNYFLVAIQENTCEKSFVFFQPYLKFMFDEVIEFPEQDLVIDSRVVKRYQFWYLKNYKNYWADPISEFISKRFVYELMPNLKGNKPFELKDGIQTEGVMELFVQHLNKKGESDCSVF
jgi:hypothetical protein